VGLDEQALELAHRQHVRERLRLLRRPQRQRRVAHDPLLLDEKAEEALERRGRSRLARHRRPRPLLVGEEGAQVRHLHLGEVADALSLQVRQARRNVALVRRAGHRGEPPLRLAEAQEVGELLRPTLRTVTISRRSRPGGYRHGFSFWQAEGRCSETRGCTPA
jgi:hypothetical protein